MNISFFITSALYSLSCPGKGKHGLYERDDKWTPWGPQCPHGQAPLPVRRPVSGVWTTARGLLYPRRKPHPQASGECLFVVVTCEVLLKRIRVPSFTFRAKLIRGRSTSHVSHVEPCVFSEPRKTIPAFSDLFLISTLSCVPYSCLVNCGQFKTLRACFVKKSEPVLSPFICSLYLFLNI